ncbi:MAG TPA: hypothetical protein PLF80_08815 [Flavobacteriales bacterium]|nr:hypothetical protein [Flavobacteriales bacterium]
MDRRHRLALALALGHTLLLAAYVLPTGMVPERAHVIGQAYARPLFHQWWGLFAPDPPACSCDWSVPGRIPPGLVRARALNGLCRHAQALSGCGSDADTCVVPVELTARVGLLTGHSTGRLRLREACLPDRTSRERPVQADRP